MKTIIQNLIEQHQYSDAMNASLQLLAEGDTSPIKQKEVLKHYNTTQEVLRWEAVDVIVDYIGLILEDNSLSTEEMQFLRLMKLYFRVKEGDFLKQHKNEQIEHILCRQLELIYRDKKVDHHESAMKVELQELFGLSYDQFLRFERKAVEQALKNGANINDLDTFYML